VNLSTAITQPEQY